MRLRFIPLLGVVVLACERAPLQTEPAAPTANGSAEFDGHHSHFRYGTMSWAPTANSGEVRFRLRAGFRRDAYSSPPNPGDTYFQDVVGETQLDYGDGNVSALVLFIVTAASVTENWVIVEALDFQTPNVGVLHTYADAGPFTAQLASAGLLGAACCRLDGPQVIPTPPFLIPGLMNRAGGRYPIPTSVSPMSVNSSPVSAIAPIVVVPENAAATFSVPAVDPDGDPIQWRLASDAEAGGGQHPPDISVDAATGLVTWNTMGLDQANFYTTTIMVEDLDGGGQVKSKTPVDFFLRVRPQIGNAPTCAVSPAGPLTGTVGAPMSFTVTGSDPDAGATVTLNSAGLPITRDPDIGLTVAASAPALPITGASPQSTVSWTLIDVTVGTHVALFTATDENGLQGICSVTYTITGNGGGGGEVAIDIKPGSDDNPVNLKSKGKIPVAVLSDADFDAASLDPASITLGNDEGSDTPVAARNNGTLMAGLEDVDQDGDLDLVLHFETQALVRNSDLDASTTELILNGLTTDGPAVQGRDVVRIVGR